jgi:hypothetical protein
VKLRVSKAGFQACQGCGTGATLRTLDVAVSAIPARKGEFKQPAVPASWCPLIALCGACWTDVRTMLREAATPDSSGEISPP